MNYVMVMAKWERGGVVGQKIIYNASSTARRKFLQQLGVASALGFASPLSSLAKFKSINSLLVSFSNDLDTPNL